MSYIALIKSLIIIFIANIIESYLAPIMIKAYINIPITFLIFSYMIYKSSLNISPIYAFLFGIYVDFISDSPIGLNASLFLMMAYFVNSYSNTFKLFSFIQICIFFSAASIFYIGFNQLFTNLNNFSYLVLFTSLIFNSFLFIIIAMLRFYLPFK